MKMADERERKKYQGEYDRLNKEIVNKYKEAKAGIIRNVWRLR